MENNNQDIKLCHVCGTKNKAIYKYCNDCGATLDQTYYTGPQNSNANTYANPYSQQNYGYNPNQQYQPNYGYNANQQYQPNYNQQYYNQQYQPNYNQQYQQNPNQTYYNGQFNQGGYTPNSPYVNNFNEPYYGTPDFDGVSAKDVYEFTGRKYKLFDKVRTQHFSNKSGPFCWIFFVLGLLLNFFGMGCWFLYHKMYKPAIGFFGAAAIGVVVSCLNAASLNSLTEKQIMEMLESNYMSFYSDTSALGPQYAITSAISSILSLVSLAITIILGFFVYKWYKNHALNRIREEYAISPMPNIYMAGKPKGWVIALVSSAYGVIFFVSIIWVSMPFISKSFKVASEYVENELYNPSPYDGYYYDFEEELPYGYDEESPYGYYEENPFGEGEPFDGFFDEDFYEDFFGGGSNGFGYDYGEDTSPFTEEEPSGEYW